ncbi:hypothetical protein B0T17DRAFT_234871 [Bombardia bombarda]|uniref:C3H1-type domain-containing protein n=1 Tax=Bombardia bombarda TaxID=252184 RepID=A0AA39XBY9_9PEZI|nr:hypothetical protein B0T17DRAFT_234871 [Bombardia bombarda]
MSGLNGIISTKGTGDLSYEMLDPIASVMRQRREEDGTLMRLRAKEDEEIMANLQHKLLRLENDLAEEKTRSNSYLKYYHAAETEKKRINASIESSSFVYVIIDGDGAIFHADLIAKGEDGGAEAALLLHDEIRESLQDKQHLLNVDQIFVQIVLNVEGLSKALVASKTLPQSEFTSLTKFGKGFSRSQPLFSFTDVGPGKDQADHKVRKIFEIMEKNLHCKALILGGCHDNGYATYLESFRSNPKIALLETTPAAAQFSRLQQVPRFRFPRVFRWEPIPPRGAAAAPHPGFQISSLPAPNSPPTTTTGPRNPSPPVEATFFRSTPTPLDAVAGTSVRREPSRATSTSSAVSASLSSPAPVSTANSYAAVGKASNVPAVIDISSQLKKSSASTPRFFYQLNRLDERVDVPLARTDMAAQNKLAEHIAKKGGVNFCNRFHVVGSCSHANCPYTHGEKLTGGELLALKWKTRSLACTSGPQCREFRCVLGHHCMNPKACSFGNNCRYKDAHGIDTTATIRVFEDGTREVLH